MATDLDFQTVGGRTYVTVDGNTGALVDLRLPSGQHSGLTFTNWIYALHMANVFGVSYRIVVFVVGLVMTVLSVTGVYIWWKKSGFRRRIALHTRHVRTTGVAAAATDATAPAVLTSRGGL